MIEKVEGIDFFAEKKYLRDLKPAVIKIENIKAQVLLNIVWKYYRPHIKYL